MIQWIGCGGQTCRRWQSRRAARRRRGVANARTLGAYPGAWENCGRTWDVVWLDPIPNPSSTPGSTPGAPPAVVQPPPTTTASPPRPPAPAGIRSGLPNNPTTGGEARPARSLARPYDGRGRPADSETGSRCPRRVEPPRGSWVSGSPGREKRARLAPFRLHLPAARRKGRLRAPARLRTSAAGADGAAIRGKARPHHSSLAGRRRSCAGLRPTRPATCSLGWLPEAT